MLEHGQGFRLCQSVYLFVVYGRITMQIQSTLRSSSVSLDTSLIKSDRAGKQALMGALGSDGADGSKGADGVKGIETNVSHLTQQLSQELQVSEQFSQDLEIINGVNTNPNANREDAGISRAQNILQALALLLERLNGLSEMIDSEPEEMSVVGEEVIQNIVQLMMHQMYDMNEDLIEDLRDPADYTLSDTR